MSSRRLPLLSAPEVEVPPGRVGRVAVEGAALVVGDTGAGEAGVRWAGRLSHELAQLERGTLVVLAGIESVGAHVSALFPPLATLRALAPASVPASDAALRALIEEARRDARIGQRESAAPLLVIAGGLALPCFRGSLNVLIGADQPILRWPAALLPERHSFELELAGDGLFVAPALARALREAGA